MSPTAAARVEWQLVTTASRAAAHRTHDQQGAAATKINKHNNQRQSELAQAD